MKYVFSCGLFFILNSEIKSQSSYYQIVINTNLILQISANNVARQGVLMQFKENYRKQKELADEGQQLMAKVYLIHEYIYGQLKNVNSLFRQGKQFMGIVKEVQEIYENAQIMVNTSVNNPQYAIFVTDMYARIIQEAVKFYNDINNVITKAKKDLLLDAHDRTVILSSLHHRLKMLKIYIKAVTKKIERAKKVAYIYSVPVLSSYIRKDKSLIISIMDRYNRLIN
ncbi:MAG: hypothetical protein Q4B43_07640 [Bacteroidota bacterium]|nr:hypothetical protein [Bacteroidota bacterium]